MVYKKIDEKPLPLDLITAGEETQMRNATRMETVEEYKELLQSGDAWPFDSKIIVFKDCDKYWLADGFHRFFAAKSLNRSSVHCVIYHGTLEDAQDYALSANSNHGLRRTNDDKRKAVTTALSMNRWASKSSRAIAEHIGVSDMFVGKIRKEMESNSGANGLHLEALSSEKQGSVKSVFGKDGKEYKATTPANPVVVPPKAEPVLKAISGHFSKDELPTSDKQWLEVAKAPEDCWIDIVERARESAGEGEILLKHFKEARIETCWKVAHDVLKSYATHLIQSVDRFHEAKPNKEAHAKCLDAARVIIKTADRWLK